MTQPSIWQSVWAGLASPANAASYRTLVLTSVMVLVVWCVTTIIRLGQGGPMFNLSRFETALVRRKAFMTPVEAETLRHLETLFPHVRIHAQVAMSALIAPARRLSRNEKLWTHRRYGQKVVDFVLQDRASGRVEVLVELDDWTHVPFKDKLRDRITAAGGYPTVRLPANMRPTRSSVESALFPFVGRELARSRVGGVG